MPGHWFGLVELLLVFGPILGWAGWQWWSWRQWRQRQAQEREQQSSPPGGPHV